MLSLAVTLTQLLEKTLDMLPQFMWYKTFSKIVSGGPATSVQTAKKGELNKLMLNLILSTLGILAAQKSTQPYGLPDSLGCVG